MLEDSIQRPGLPSARGLGFLVSDLRAQLMSIAAELVIVQPLVDIAPDVANKAPAATDKARTAARSAPFPQSEAFDAQKSCCLFLC